jgi:protein TonB
VPKTTRTPAAKFNAASEADPTTSPETGADTGSNQLGTPQGQGEMQNGSGIDPSTEQAEERFIAQYLQVISGKINKVKRYPRQARRKGWEGTVVIELHILSSGDVEKVTLIEKSKYQVLDEAALKAIKRTLPFPKFPDGLEIRAITVTVPLRFELK